MGYGEDEVESKLKGAQKHYQTCAKHETYDNNEDKDQIPPGRVHLEGEPEGGLREMRKEGIRYSVAIYDRRCSHLKLKLKVISASHQLSVRGPHDSRPARVSLNRSHEPPQCIRVTQLPSCHNTQLKVSPGGQT